MFRISRLTDYGTVILVYLANQEQSLSSASEIAAGTQVAQPTAQKLLKVLAHTDLVESVRGTDGGYRLARPPVEITAAEILDVLEGPVAITECSQHDSHCELESSCKVSGAWQKINGAIRIALSEISLADLGRPQAEMPAVQLADSILAGRTPAN